MKDMVRVYLSDFRITRETIDEVFRSHGDVLPEAEIERLGHFLNWKDPVLVAGPERFGWDLVRGNPLFHAYQAARERSRSRLPTFPRGDASKEARYGRKARTT